MSRYFEHNRNICLPKDMRTVCTTTTTLPGRKWVQEFQKFPWIHSKSHKNFVTVKKMHHEEVKNRLKVTLEYHKSHFWGNVFYKKRNQEQLSSDSHPKSPLPNHGCIWKSARTASLRPFGNSEGCSNVPLGCSACPIKGVP